MDIVWRVGGRGDERRWEEDGYIRDRSRTKMRSMTADKWSYLCGSQGEEWWSGTMDFQLSEPTRQASNWVRLM